MIKKKNTVGVPCAATEMMTQAQKATDKLQQRMQGFINRIGGQSITPKEDKLRQAILEKIGQDNVQRRCKNV